MHARTIHRPNVIAQGRTVQKGRTLPTPPANHTLHLRRLHVILNQLDYCSSLCLGLPYVRLRPLDGVLRTAARLIGGVPKFGHIGEFMRDTLLWLPVRQRVLYRVSTIAWRCILGVAPAYLSELCVLSSSCPGRPSLRSSSRGDYLIPRSYTVTKQNRSFSAAGPSTWNGLPLELRSLPCDFSRSFYSLLKTFLFAQAWAGSF